MINIDQPCSSVEVEEAEAARRVVQGPHLDELRAGGTTTTQRNSPLNLLALTPRSQSSLPLIVSPLDC
jgi:hypothetical protein